MCSNSLVEIPVSDLPKIRDLYKKNWPKHYIGYHTLDNYIQWFNKDPNLSNIKIYSLNGDWSDGSFLIFDNYQIIINTCNENNYENVLNLLNQIDWNIKRDVFAFLDSLKNTIDSFIKTNKLKFNYKVIETIWYYMPKEKFLKLNFEVPEGFLLKQLDESDGEIVNTHWPWRKENSVNYIKRLIKYNSSIGLFTNDGELVGWMLRSQVGTLGLLQVKDEYKRRGFGSLLVKALGKIVAELGNDISVTVVTSNTASRRLFEKLGFEGIDKIYWIDSLRKE